MVIKAAKDVTSTIPIVIAGVTSPVELGFVQSLARPGGNITGLSTLVLDLLGKRAELIKELVPNMRRLAFLNSEENSPEARRVLKETSRRMGFSFLLAEHSVRDFANAFALVRRGTP